MQFLLKSIQKVLEFYLYSQNSKTSFFATFNFAKTPKYKSILHSHTFNNLYQPYVHCKGTWLVFPKMTSDWPLTSHLTFGATTWEPLFWHVQKGPKSGNFELDYLQKSARPTMLMHMTMYTKGEGNIPWKKVCGPCEVWHGNWIWKSAIFISWENNQAIWRTIWAS